MGVGLVVVSHSHALAVAAVELAREMAPGDAVRISTAAGLDETTFGTDAARIAEAVAEADSGAAGVVVLMDLGSAVLSAELALELVDDAVRERVTLCPAPLVEGLVVAAVAAAGGADRATVAAEASGALAAKLTQLAPAEPAAGHDDRAQPGADRPEGSDDSVGSDGLAAAVTEAFTVRNPHGLHARPASRLVLELGGLDARAELRNRTTDSAWVPASSLSRVATLGVLAGHQVELRVTGRQATEAAERVRALAERDFDEHTDGSSVTPPPAARVSGPRVASPGIAVGPARFAGRAPIEIPDRPSDDPHREWQRLCEAIEAVRGDIEQVRARAGRELGEAEAGIFEAHLVLLADPDLLDQVRARLDAGQAAAPAWAEAVAQVGRGLAALPDDYQRARAADVDAVGRQVLRALVGAPTQAEQLEGVLVAPDLVPAEAAELDATKIRAVVLAFGSPTSHASILLRAKGIPALVGAGATVLDIAEGTGLAVDAERGELVVDPSDSVHRGYLERAAELGRRARRAREQATRPAVTADGVEIHVGANIGSVQDARAGAERGADLAGLVRTEFLFLDRCTAPDADEQEQVYRDIAAAMGGRRITLRTLDVGGDKPLDYLPMPAEANPYLGVRGIRLSLARPELLAEQLLAIVRVAHDTPVSVMFPMVSTLDELRAARRMLDEAVAGVGRGRPEGLRVGIMVEVPAAALKASVLAPHVDFFSIGTNDLTQYALAADRGNDAVSGVGTPFDPGLLRLVEATCRGAAEAEVPPEVAVCGEFAADERATALLLGLGVRELSVNPRAVPTTKLTVRGVELARARALAVAALRADGAEAVLELLESAASVR